MEIKFDALIDKKKFLSEFIKIVEKIEKEKIHIIQKFTGEHKA